MLRGLPVCRFGRLDLEEVLGAWKARLVVLSLGSGHAFPIRPFGLNQR